MKRIGIVASVLSLAWGTASARADMTVPGADGTDGAFTFVGDAGNANQMTIDLSQAPTGIWNGTNAAPGKGVYDPDKWAVIFRYSSVSIASGKTVKFTNRSCRAPVVWLVNGDVTIAGTVNLDGQPGTGSLLSLSEPGPGGFRGGRGKSGLDDGAGGFGPGGAGFKGSPVAFGAGGSYATSGATASVGCGGSAGMLGGTYGNDRMLPLLGGSGGSAKTNGCGVNSTDNQGGGAGGGAILIAATGKISVTGTISASGGAGNNYYAGSGSGGAIRLLADRVEGGGNLRANSLANTSTQQHLGGNGRIHLEANQIAYTGGSSPVLTSNLPDNPILIWPPAAAPTLKVVKLTQAAGGADIPVPADPQVSPGFADVNVNTNQQVTLYIAATNVPINWPVVVRIVPFSGDTITVTAGPLQGDAASSTTTATFTPPKGMAAIQLRAANPNP